LIFYSGTIKLQCKKDLCAEHIEKEYGDRTYLQKTKKWLDEIINEKISIENRNYFTLFLEDG